MKLLTATNSNLDRPRAEFQNPAGQVFQTFSRNSQLAIAIPTYPSNKHSKYVILITSYILFASLDPSALEFL